MLVFCRLCVDVRVRYLVCRSELLVFAYSAWFLPKLQAACAVGCSLITVINLATDRGQGVEKCSRQWVDGGESIKGVFHVLLFFLLVWLLYIKAVTTVLTLSFVWRGLVPADCSMELMEGNNDLSHIGKRLGESNKKTHVIILSEKICSILVLDNLYPCGKWHLCLSFCKLLSLISHVIACETFFYPLPPVTANLFCVPYFMDYKLLWSICLTCQKNA